MPFRTFRAFMYTVKELLQVDKDIYEYYLAHQDLISAIAQSTHGTCDVCEQFALLTPPVDYSIKDALYDYLEGKTVVSIMGDHAMRRASPEYREVVELARALAREGFLVTTGGGPGAMEAANLGGYLADKYVLLFY